MAQANLLKQFCNFEGRIDRGKFWAACAFYFVSSALIYVLILLMLGGVFATFIHTIFGIFAFAAVIALRLAIMLVFLRFYVRRLHDAGLSGWWMSVLLLWFLFLAGLMLWEQQQEAPPGVEALILLFFVAGVPGPILTVMTVFVGSIPGSKGANRFGEPPAGKIA